MANHLSRMDSASSEQGRVDLGPMVPAGDFLDALERAFHGACMEVVFAISHWSSDRKFLGPFRDTLT